MGVKPCGRVGSPRLFPRWLRLLDQINLRLSPYAARAVLRKERKKNTLQNLQSNFRRAQWQGQYVRIRYLFVERFFPFAELSEAAHRACEPGEVDADDSALGRVCRHVDATPPAVVGTSTPCVQRT